MAVTLLDAPQVIVHVFDEDAQALRTVGTGIDGATVIEGTGPGGAVPVVISGASGLDVLSPNNIAFGNITTSYYEVEASSANDYSKVAIYDTTGETIELAIGPMGSEVLKLIIGPGNDQILDVNIPSGSRIAVRSAANAVAGSLILNFIGAL